MTNILPFISLGLSAISLTLMVWVNVSYRRIIRRKDKLLDDAMEASGNLIQGQEELIITLLSALESEDRLMVISGGVAEHYRRPSSLN